MYRVPNLIKLTFFCFLIITNTVNANESNLRVVTSFSILEDLVNVLGGDKVNVVNLVGRDSDAHMYQPKPSDAVAISKADLVVFNGLGFEGWMSRLIKNSGYNNTQLVASEGVDVLTAGDEVDPHAWQSFKNIRFYINNISLALTLLKPEYATEFKQRQKAYLSQLDALEQKIVEQLSTIAQENRIVVTSHDAFGYLAREFNIQFLAPVGRSIEGEASAADVAEVINQIRELKVKAIFVENITNPRLLQRIADETGVVIGGHLYSDALSASDGPASTYLNMMRHNVESLINAFLGASS